MTLIKILGGSILSAVGFFLVFWAIVEVVSRAALDIAFVVMVHGVPLLMIGLAFYIKGMKEYLKEKQPLNRR